jgi:ADP-ribose pyrophosphatase
MYRLPGHQFHTAPLVMNLNNFPRPTRGPRENVYSNEYMEIYRVRLEFPTHSKVLYVSDYGCRVGTVVEGPMGVLFTRQYRYLIDDISLEIPGGKVDSGEILEDAARRECLEETGVLCGLTCPLLTFQQGLDTSNNPTYLYYTRSFEVLTADFEVRSNEVVGREWIPLAKCLEMIASGKIVDSLSVIALLAYNTLANNRD